MSQWTDLEAARLRIVEVEQSKDYGEEYKAKTIADLKKDISKLEIEIAAMERIAAQRKH